MAEYYFNYKSHKSGGGFTAVSRGIYAEAGGSMAANSRQALVAHNIIGDSEEIPHKPGQIDEEIMRGAYLAFGITENHAALLRSNFPDYADKIRAMPEDIGDPYGSNPEVYAACFERIRSAVDIIISELASESNEI
jgi:protein-tyrosine-phosphatase